MRQIILLFISLLLLGACASTGIEPLQPPSANSYRIAAGDKVRVNVFGEERLSGDFLVESDGSIQIPLLGRIGASGLTAAEFQDRLTQGLATSVLRNPNVTVSMIGVRPVYVLGEVSNPGEFGFVDGLTVYQLVARAGGFTYRANQSEVNIRHAGGDAEKTYRLTASTPVAPGDTVRIGERLF